MQKNKSKMLTEAALVAELRECGYTDISIRTIEEWRRRELLPEFDQKGRGLGRGAGREPSIWLDGELVVERAAWVSDLIRVYGRMDDAYFPLWMLGYSVRMELIKEALEQPLEEIGESLQEEMKAEEDLGFEDFIDGAVYEACQNARKSGLGAYRISQVMMSVAYNLFFNPEYDLNDEPFRRAVEAFRLREARRGNQPRTPNDDNAANLFEFAPFIKEHLSFKRLKETLQHCTDEDLRMVERDLGVMREIVHHCDRMLKALLSEVPAEFTEGFVDKWDALFTVGRVCVLADLSLRRSGYGDCIDYVLSEALNQVRALCDENLERELRANGAQLVASFRTVADEWVQKLAADAEPVSTRKGRGRKTAVSEMAA